MVRHKIHVVLGEIYYYTMHKKLNLVYEIAGCHRCEKWNVMEKWKIYTNIDVEPVTGLPDWCTSMVYSLTFLTSSNNQKLIGYIILS